MILMLQDVEAAVATDVAVTDQLQQDVEARDPHDSSTADNTGCQQGLNGGGSRWISAPPPLI